MHKTNRHLVVIIRNAFAFDFGGAERFPNFLAETLGEVSDFTAVVVSRHQKLLAFAKLHNVSHIKGWWWSQQNWTGWRVIGTPVYVLWQLVLFCWYVVLFLRLKPAVVHPQGKDDFIAATLAGRAVGARVVWSDFADLKHIWKNVRHPLKNPVGKLVYLAALAAHAITVVSDADLRLVAANLSPKSRVLKKLVTVHNGVYDRYSDYPPKTSPGHIAFSCASRLVRDKGIGELIASFQKLHAEHPNTSLVLMGDGPERKTFEAMLQPDDGIQMTGHLDNPLPNIAQTDIFVHPTYHEGFSIALIEASMLAKAIIATDVGGNPEIITHNQTGLLIPVKDTAALHAAMQTLYTDQQLRQKLASAAREHFVQSLTLQKVVAQKFVPLYTND